MNVFRLSRKKEWIRLWKISGVRNRFTEEISDVLMYYIEVLNRLNISAEELSEAYVKKHQRNLDRNYSEENKKKYNG